MQVHLIFFFSIILTQGDGNLYSPPPLQFPLLQQKDPEGSGRRLPIIVGEMASLIAAPFNVSATPKAVEAGQSHVSG